MRHCCGRRCVLSSVLFSREAQASEYEHQGNFLLVQEHIELARADFPLVFKDILDKQHFESNMFFR